MRFYRYILLVATAFASIPKEAQSQENLTIGEAMELLNRNSNTIQMANKGVEIARAEKQRLNSTWYPYINASGTYLMMSEEIKVEENIGKLAGDVAAPLAEALPQLAPLISLASNASLTFPLLDKNVATIDGIIVWPLFTGGKRIYANRIGKSLVNSAHLNRQITQKIQTTLLVERYYTVKLLTYNLEVCNKELAANRRLYENSLKLMENGLINKAEMLVAKMAFDQSAQKVSGTARKVKDAEKSLSLLLGMDTTLTTYGPNGKYLLSSPFFICTSIPSEAEFINLACNNNPQTKLIDQQREMAQNNRKIAKSSYMPDISIFAKQNIYSYNIPSNLLPRSTIGAAFTWTIFDGTNRERRIEIAKLQEESLELGKREGTTEVERAVRGLYSIMEDARESLETVTTSISLAQELVKIRERGFSEGVATASEVVEANALLAKSNLAAMLSCYQYEIALSNMIALCGESLHFSSFLNREGNIYR